MKASYDKKRTDPPQYQVGDLVMLDSKDFNETRPSKKLSDRKLGPFKIIEVIPPLNYRLELPNTIPVHPVFNTVKLTKYKPPFAEEQKHKKPSPVQVQGTEEYELDSIVDSRRKGFGIQYLVKWKGWGEIDKEWKAGSTLNNAVEMVKEFHRLNPDKPKPKTRT